MNEEEIIARVHAPRIVDVQAAVCRRFHLSRAEVLGDNRSRSVSRPRQIAMYLAVRLSCRTVNEVAAHFNRDHSTVLHARRAVQRLCTEDRDLKNVIEDLARELEETCPCARCAADRGRFAMDPPQLVLPMHSASELGLGQVAA